MATFPGSAGTTLTAQARALGGFVNQETLAAGKTLDGASANVQILDPDGSSRTITLAKTAYGTAIWLVYNAANAVGELLNIVDAAAVAITSLDAGEAAFIAYDGTSWRSVPLNVTDAGDGTIQADVIQESTAGAGVTADGLRLKDAAVAPVAGGAAFIDLTACATGEADVILADNLASAFELRQGATTYLKAVTTNDAERIDIAKPLKLGIQTIDMADAAHALVYGTAGAAQTQVTGNYLVVDPNSGGASEDLTLPPEATSTGIMLVILNSGGEGIVVKDDAGGTVITLDTAQHGLVICDGTTWRGFMGGVT